MGKFQDKVVVVIGAGSGIGRATALAFAREGASVHVVDIDGERARAVTTEINRNDVRAAVAHTVDCSKLDQMESLAESIYKMDSRVDIIQNGAGVLVSAPVEKIAVEAWRRSIDVNLWGVINSLIVFLPRMLSQGGGGHVINIASLAGLIGFPYTAPYSTTKFAIVGLTEAIAIELGGRGINFTTVCPGAVSTNLMNDGLLDLPGRWADLIRNAIDKHATNPDLIADRILEAVFKRKGLIVPSPEVLPLWWMKRLFDEHFRYFAGRAAAVLVRK